jgi:hypothetical protein
MKSIITGETLPDQYVKDLMDEIREKNLLDEVGSLLQAATSPASPYAGPTLRPVPIAIEAPAAPTEVRKKKLAHPHGRKPDGHTRVLIRALTKIQSRMPNGGTLPEWCDRLRGSRARFQFPASDRRAGQSIDYAVVIQDKRYDKRIYMRFKRILRGKLKSR